MHCAFEKINNTAMMVLHVEYDLNFISLPNVKALFWFRRLMFSSLNTHTSVAAWIAV